MREFGFPTSLRNRELGFNYKTGTILPKLNPHGFKDLNCQTVQSLETRGYLSLKVNQESYASEFEPIPIYCLDKVGDRLIASDEGGMVHVVRGWFNHNNYDPAKTPADYCHVSSTQLASNSAVYSIKHIGGKLAAGTGHGHLAILDLDSFELVRMYDSHEKSVKKVDSFNGEIVVTCSRDNTINVHDLRVKSVNPVNTIINAHTISTCGTPTGNSHSTRNKSALPKASPSNSVTDVVFIDEYNLISSGAADGLLKQWDLRVTYKHMKKFHPVQVIEFPGSSNSKGYGGLKIANSKLYASTVLQDIFQFDLGTMAHEVTYLSPSKLSYYTKLDVSHDGCFLASGSEEQKVHLFKTVPIPIPSSKESIPFIHPIHTLTMDKMDEECNLPICCVVFSPADDLMLTTGGDSSIVNKWIPGVYLYSSSEREAKLSKKYKEEPELPEIKTELKYLYQKRKTDNLASGINNRNFSSTDRGISGYFEQLQVQKNLRLDSFPNYVIDGMRLPHVHPRIKIKLRRLTSDSSNWLKSPESTKSKRRIVEETTPKSRNASRKRKKFSENGLSPKIFEFFKVSTTPTSPNVVYEH